MNAGALKKRKSCARVDSECHSDSRPISSCCYGNSTYVTLAMKKSKVCVVNLCGAIFDDQWIKGLRENGEWNTNMKTV